MKMSIWIRTQNKKRLIECNDIELVEMERNGQSKLIVNLDADGSWADIGFYSTKERALQVLDEIQTAIFKSTIALSSISGNVNALEEEQLDKLASYIVYEMPKE